MWFFVGSLRFLALLRSGAAAEAAGVVSVDGRRAIAATGEYFVCATLDWWPPDKCDYGTCSWGRAGLLNLVTASSSSPSTDSCSVSSQISRRIDTIFFITQDLSNKILLNAVRGRRRRRSFSPDILAGAAASSSTDPLPMLRISFCFFHSVHAAEAPAGRLAAGQGGVRRRRRAGAVRAVRQERVGDARLHAGLPAHAPLGRAQRLLPEIRVGLNLFLEIISLIFCSVRRIMWC